MLLELVPLTYSCGIERVKRYTEELKTEKRNSEQYAVPLIERCDCHLVKFATAVEEIFTARARELVVRLVEEEF